MQKRNHIKHQNAVRIVGGKLRGCKIHFSSAAGLRPTPDSVRERLFNWLGQDLTGQTVLDLFAGSGALGFESASRHAKQVVMCEIHRDTVQNLRHHARQFQIDSMVQIQAQDGLRYLTQTAQMFDLVLLDPPFAWQNWGELFQVLGGKVAEGGFVYLEAAVLPELPVWLSVYRQGRAGKSQFLLCEVIT